ncbi:MAG: hypothetical protein ACLRVT_07860 [Oscillospiraceae bacterium]
MGLLPWCAARRRGCGFTALPRWRAYPLGAQMLYDAGFARVVLSRELSLRLGNRLPAL